MACDHTAPFAYTPPTDIGPHSDAFPRQLTFNLGDDREPFVTGDTVVFSRLDPAQSKVNRCIDMMPVEGGTIFTEFCPASADDSVNVNAWREPVLSPDRSTLAFVWQRGLTLSPGAQADTLMIVSAADPSQVLHRWKLDSVDAGLGVLLAYPSKPVWVDDATLRFLYSTFSVTYLDPRAPGYGTNHTADTTVEPVALVDLDVASGKVTPIPGTDGVTAYTMAPDGGVWFSTLGTGGALLHLAPGASTPDTAGMFSASVADLTVLDGRPVALLASREAVETIDTTGVGRVVLAMMTPARRIVGAPGGHLVVSLEVSSAPLGDRANLWLESPLP